jgi:hypothetical protein
MSRMRFLSQNLFNTTSMAVVDSNTDGVANLFDKNVASGWTSSGYTGATKTTISIEFGTTTVIDTLLLRRHNFKDFRVFYNSVTANVLSPDINVSSNSDTSSFFSFATTTVSSLQIQIDGAQTAATERQIAEIVAAALQVEFERNPAAGDYNAERGRKQVVHNMPDGGVAVYNIAQKFNATIRWKYITQGFHDSLLDAWEVGEPMIFVPFPTTTGWAGIMPECAWIGAFNFKYSSSGKSAGYSGSILLKETS